MRAAAERRCRRAWRRHPPGPIQAWPATVSDWARDSRRLRRAVLALDDGDPEPPVEFPPRVRAALGPRANEEVEGGDTEAHLEPAAVLVGIVRRPGGARVLLTRRCEHLRRHAGEVSFPGGRPEPGDATAADTALRESFEEIALNPAGVEIIGRLAQYPTITGFCITPVVGWIATAPRLQADQVEVASIIEVPLTTLEDANNFQRRYLERNGMKLPYFRVTYDEQIIWGATAAMLWDLRTRLAHIADKNTPTSGDNTPAGGPT